MNRWTLRFGDATLEKLFNAHTVAHALPAIRAQYLIATFAYMMFGVLDFVLLHEAASETFANRAIVCTIILILMLSSYLPNATRFFHVITTAGITTGGLGILWMVATLPAPYSYYYYAGIPVIIIFACNIHAVHYLVAGGMSLTLALLYILVATVINPIPIEVLISNTFFIFTTLAWTTWTAYRQENYRRQEFASKYYLHLEKLRSDDLLEAARAGNKAKSEFLAVISHELRTPLNAIIGFSEIMRNQLFGPLGSDKYISYADDIAESGNHLLSVINDILDISKAEAGKLDVCEDEVEIGALITQTLRMIRDKAIQGGLSLVYEPPATLPLLWADSRLLKQVLINLLSNAVKFTPPGGRIEITADRAADGGFNLIVADTGIGIPQDQIPQVLEPFVQVESALSRKHGGTGLGLPLVRRIAELHGGSFRLTSEPGKGTVATFYLPAARVMEKPRMPALSVARA